MFEANRSPWIASGAGRVPRGVVRTAALPFRPWTGEGFRYASHRRPARGCFRNSAADFHRSTSENCSLQKAQRKKLRVGRRTGATRPAARACQLKFDRWNGAFGQLGRRDSIARVPVCLQSKPGFNLSAKGYRPRTPNMIPASDVVWVSSSWWRLIECSSAMQLRSSVRDRCGQRAE